MIENVDWLGHASFRIVTDEVIYIDPWKLQDDDKADLILITHPHYDHFSIDDIKKIQKEGTVIVSIKEVIDKLKEDPEIYCELTSIRPDQSLLLNGIDIEAILAYNKNKEYHKKSFGWVGYIINVLGERLYFTGDTDYIHEMNSLDDIDIAFIPIGGEYTMDINDAVRATLMIGPKYVVPMHYGDIIGHAGLAESFEEKVREEDPSIEVVIKTPEYASDL